MKLSYMWLTLSGVVLLCLGPGCTKQRTEFEASLVSRIATKCQDRFPCTVSAKEVTDFEWDKLYVFKYTAHRGVVEKAIGTRLQSFKEFRRRVVFTKNGKVVFYEEEPTDIEHPMNNEVVFDIPDSSDYSVYDADAAFNVQKIPTSSGSYYQLKQKGAA